MEEARQKLYKAGPRQNVTLTERIRKTKSSQFAARKDRFFKGRAISVEDSPTTTPKPQNLIKASKIVDRREKLQAYRFQKNAQKIKEVQEQKSPFTVFVPVGRWVEKKEKKPNSAAQFALNDTPVRNVMMNERVLKKSTIKKMLDKGTARKKENASAPGKYVVAPKPNKSKKKILGELNSEVLTTPVDLNSTFEILPEASSVDLSTGKCPEQTKRRSKSDSDLPMKFQVKSTVKKFVARPAPRTEMKHQTIVAKKPASQAPKKKVPSKFEKNGMPKLSKQIFEYHDADKQQVHPKTKEDKIKDQVPKNSNKPTTAETSTSIISNKISVLQSSMTYKLYKSSLDTQIRYLSMQLQEIENGKSTFFPALLDEEQVSMNKTVLQTQLLITDKLGKFDELLDQFESYQKKPQARINLTEDDIENYWFIIYEEIEKTKTDLVKAHETMRKALRAVASAKRRRTRKIYVPDEGTPKRSRRIADNAETPKHNSSCYGCNTPRSASKRRITIKKNVLFDVETPKRAGSSQRSSNCHKTNSTRNLMRMNAINIDNSENDFVEFV